MKKISFGHLLTGAFLAIGISVQAQYFDYGTNIFDNSSGAGIPASPYNDVARDVSVMTGLNANLSITVGSRQKNSTSGKYEGYIMARLADPSSTEEVKWYITINGSGNNEVNGVDTRVVNASTGYIYVTGSFTGSSQMILHRGFPIHHDSVYVTPSPLVAPSGLSNDITYFVSKFDQNGTHIWTYVAGEPTFYNAEGGYDVDVAVVGGQVKVHTTGYYRSNPEFRSAGSAITVTASVSYDAMFTAQYTDNGTTATCNWVRTIGETTNAHDRGYGIDADASTGNVYVTGAIGGNTGAMTVSGTSDVVLCKYNSSGTLQWAQNFGGNGTSALGAETDAGRGITYRKEGTNNFLYVSGHYTGAGVFTTPPSGVMAGFFTKIKDTGTGISYTDRSTIVGTGTTLAYRNTISPDGSRWYITGAKTGTATVRQNNSTIVEVLPPIYQPTARDGFMIVFKTDQTVLPTPYIDAINIGGGEYIDVAAGVDCYTNSAVYICGSYQSSYLAADNVLLTDNYMYYGPYEAYLIRYITGSPKTAAVTGIDELSGTGSVAYPNPTHGNVTILKTTDSDAVIEIMDITGRLVRDRFTAKGTTLHLDLSGLGAGLYYIRLTEEGRVENFKVTKQ